jgi:hypothetical protein
MKAAEEIRVAGLARVHTRSLLYIDEIDTFGMRRDNDGHESDTRLLLTAMLAALDGLRSSGRAASDRQLKPLTGPTRPRSRSCWAHWLQGAV